MTEDAKKIIENNINLINEDDSNSWGDFFLNFENELQMGHISDCEALPEIRKILESCGIDPLKHLDYIPSGYYYGDPTIKAITIPDDIITIKSFAFFDCSHMESIELPSTLLTIEENAFQYCSAINTIKIPVSIEFIHTKAFAYCKNLKEILYLGTMKQFTDIELGDKVFYYCGTYQIKCTDGIIKLDEYGEPDL